MKKYRLLFLVIPAVLILAYAALWLPWLTIKWQSNTLSELSLLQPADATIVFGGLYYPDQEMTETNAERLLTAKAIYDEGITEHIIVSNTELAAEAMKQYLVSHGVPSDAITTDTTAIVTEDTCVAEFNAHEGARDVIFVSHGYHLPRILYMCERIGVSGQGFAAETLGVIERSDLPAFTKMNIRYTRSWREATLTFLGMIGVYQPTLELTNTTP